MTRNRLILGGLFFILIIIALFTPVTLNQLKVGDYPHNIEQMEELSQNGYVYLKANLLFHRITLVVRDVLPYNFLVRVSPLLKQIIDLKSYEIASLLVVLLAELATGFSLWRFFEKQLSVGQVSREWILSGILAAILLVLGPITLFTLPEKQYFGYFTGNPVHNAPYIVMKCFAVIFFILLIENVYKTVTVRTVVLTAGALGLATLAKPNIALSILPAFFIVFGLIRVKEIRNRNLVILAASTTILTVAILISQYIIMYTGDRGESILIAPFKVMLLTSPNILSVLFTMVMSIAFPLAVTVMWWKSLRSIPGIQLAWINFVISLAYAYLLSEQTDMASANFGWGVMVAVFLLFMVSIPVLVNKIRQGESLKGKLTWKTVSAGLLLGMHLVCGIIFLYSSTISTSLVP